MHRDDLRVNKTPVDFHLPGNQLCLLVHIQVKSQQWDKSQQSDVCVCGAGERQEDGASLSLTGLKMWKNATVTGS